MGYYRNINHSHLVALSKLLGKNKCTTALKRASKHHMSMENECNQHITKVEPSLLSEAGLGVKKQVSSLTHFKSAFSCEIMEQFW